MKLISLSIALLTVFLPFTPVKAEPNLCKLSAITFKEKEAVDILQEIYLLQLEMKSKQQNIDKINERIIEYPNRSDSNAVALHNSLVEKYNSIVREKNQLSNRHNELKDSYNALLHDISPSSNLAFTNCLNSELLDINTNTTRLNIDSLNTRIDNLRNNIESLQY